jgi:integrase
MHIRKRTLPSGKARWQVRTSVATGGRREERARDFTSERAAKQWARDHGNLIERRGAAAGETTVAGYFERWLQHLEEAGSVQAKTLYEYQHNLRRLVPLIGSIRLDRLTTLDLDQSYARLLRRGGRGGKPLHPRTVYVVHRTVSAALKRARKWKLIPDNPAQDAEPPSPGKSRANAPTPDQLKAYLQAVRPTPFWPFILATICTGLRRGELLGLAWSAVDLENNVIEVRQVMCEVGAKYWLRPHPKTEAGFRKLTIPLILASELAWLRLKQKEEMLAYGRAYRRDLDLVFSQDGGQPWQPNRLSRKIAPLARGAGLPLTCKPLHGLRHGHATALLKQGIPVKVTSERLGHASITITSDLYQHVDEELDRRAADAIDRVLAEALADTRRT